MNPRTRSDGDPPAPRPEGNPAGAGMCVLADRIAAALTAAGARPIIIDQGRTADQLLPPRRPSARI